MVVKDDAVTPSGRSGLDSAPSHLFIYFIIIIIIILRYLKMEFRSC
jgi:hypothetical protein